MELRTGNCSLHSDAKLVPATSSPLYVHFFGLARRAECLIHTAAEAAFLPPLDLPPEAIVALCALIALRYQDLRLSEMADNLFSRVPFPGHKAPFLRPIS